MDVQLIKLLNKECITIALNARSCFIIISANTLKNSNFMNILNKILGIPHYPTTFKGHTIDYNFAKDKCRYCGNIAYGAYANKSDIGRKVACLYYCPNCQKLFGIPKLSDPILVGKY